jgi:hypothetical protein
LAKHERDSSPQKLVLWFLGLDLSNHGMLQECIEAQEPEYKLLRRRVALVLGQWVPVKAGELNMNAIYQIFQALGENSYESSTLRSCRPAVIRTTRSFKGSCLPSKCWNGKHDPLNDLVVRITAGRQLRSVLDSYEFSPNAFNESSTLRSCRPAVIRTTRSFKGSCLPSKCWKIW